MNYIALSLENHRDVYGDREYFLPQFSNPVYSAKSCFEKNKININTKLVRSRHLY